MKAHGRVFALAALLAVALMILGCAQQAAPAVQQPAGATSVPAATSAPAATEKYVVNVYTDGDTNISDWLANKVGPAFEKAYF